MCVADLCATVIPPTNLISDAREKMENLNGAPAP